MSEQHALPKIFDSFSEPRQKGFLEMKTLKDQGKKVVGTFCTYTPLELILAAGLVPVGLCADSDEPIAEAEKTLPRNLCPLIKASYGFAAADKCPYMYFSDLVVGETTCDGKKKMYELLGQIKNVHIMELPQSQTKPAARRLWLSEIRLLKEKLEEMFGVTITDEALREAIRFKNKERALMKECYELSLADPPPLSGVEQLRFLHGVQFRFDQSRKLEEMAAALAEAQENYKNGRRPVDSKAKRILITGCPMGGATEKVTRAVEESGGVVVVYENCSGAKQVDRPVPEEGDPYEALADYYLSIGCSVMTPNPNRLELLERLYHQFNAVGVVEMTLQACHTYAVETQIIRDFLKNRDIPYLALETDYSQGDAEQLKTRVAAFLEMI